MTPQQQFFYDNAGYSYDPQRETAEQGRRKCAQTLAAAEDHAKRSGISYRWRRDDLDSREFSDERPFYPLYVCVAFKHGEVIASLCGIDFGRGNHPQDPYKRVVEAELACEDYHESEQSQDAACRDIQTV